MGIGWNSLTWAVWGEGVMEDLLRQKVNEFARRLAEEESQRLAKVITLYDIETLTTQIGDELSRQLTNAVMIERSAEVSSQPLHPCPACQEHCPIEDDEPQILRGLRGEIEYSEPRCHCTRCRRDFFPSGRRSAARSP